MAPACAAKGQDQPSFLLGQKPWAHEAHKIDYALEEGLRVRSAEDKVADRGV